MKTMLAGFAGSLLALTVCLPALARPHAPAEPAKMQHPDPAPKKTDKARQTAYDAPTPGSQLTPEQRRQLRQDLIEAGRALYGHPHREQHHQH